MSQTQRSDTKPLIIKEISLAGLYGCKRQMRGVNDGIQTGRATYEPPVVGVMVQGVGLVPLDEKNRPATVLIPRPKIAHSNRLPLGHAG